jgi:hypothetical protein
MLWNVLKKVILWSYGRTTWQYDVLCALILAFVFLTPKGWFERGELACAPAHQTGLKAARKLLIRTTGTASATQTDAHELERCARKITGDPNVRVRGWKAVESTDGRTVGFEVDTEP